MTDPHSTMTNERLERIADQAGRLASVGSGRIAGVRLDAFAEDVFDLLAYAATLELALTQLIARHEERPDG